VSLVRRDRLEPKRGTIGPEAANFLEHQCGLALRGGMG
jgi:hypothetical protein